MSSDLCKNCGKPPLAGRAGSVTSYFFQHNYCQCAANRKAAALAGSSDTSASPVCANCGKSRPTDKRAGSFTSFLFKELRCNCAGQSTKPSNKQSNKQSTFGKKTSRTLTSHRLGQKKYFTESIKQRTPQPGGMAETINLAKGTIIGGNYRVLSQIGLGGMGAVYLVEQTALNKQFALKVLIPAIVNEQTWQRFKTEAKTMASLQHPSFVNVYDLGIHANTLPFYSMDFLSGQTLEEILAEEGPLELEPAINIFIEILNGLAYAHRNGIIHRDIKPANIMLCTTNGVTAVKILDFGISKLNKENASQLQDMTMAGDIFGSPYYMSPEQCLGSAIDARADIYSIGCTLFEVLTGYVPFEGDNSIDTILKHQEETAPLLGDAAQQIFSPNIEAVVATCLAKLPRDRYQSAKELAIDLERIKTGNDIQASSPAFRQLSKVAERLDELEVEADEARAGDGNRLKPNNLTKIIGVSAITTLLLIVTFAAISLKPNEKRARAENEKRSLAAADGAKDIKDHVFYSDIIGNKIRFNFPEDHAIGEIGIARRRGNLKAAKSIVEFPIGTKLIFKANEYTFGHPEVMSSFRPTDFTEFTAPPHNTYLSLQKLLPYISKLSALEQVCFYATKFSDHNLLELEKLPNLVDLNLDSTNVTTAGLSKFKRLLQLRVLHLGANSNQEVLLKALAGSEALEELSLDSLATPLSEADAKLICSCKNITRLALEASVSSDQVLEVLCELPKLNYLDIEYCLVSRKTVDQIKKKNPDLVIMFTKLPTPKPVNFDGE